jgi:hypothetical protein
VPDANVAARPDGAVESRPRGQVLRRTILRVRSRASKDRQYWTMIVGFPSHCSAARNPCSGAAASSAIMRGIARATGSHLCTFQNRLIRMPIRNTTISPSIRAVTRSA